MFGYLTVADSVALPLRYHHDCPPEEALPMAMALLDWMELAENAADSPMNLGSSRQQRVGLARAMALKPDLLFLDEPLAGMGWGHRQWWLDFLDRLTKGAPQLDGRKVAVIVTTNDFEPWQGRAVQFATIKDRRWQATGGEIEPPTVDQTVFRTRTKA